MKGPQSIIGSFFPIFSNTLNRLLENKVDLAFAVEAVLTAFLDDGCAYLELRTIPKKTMQMSRREYVQVVLQVMQEFEASHPISDKAGLLVRLILAIDRSG